MRQWSRREAEPQEADPVTPAPAASPLSGPLLDLQRRAGNRAVNALVGQEAPTIRRAVTVGGAAYEVGATARQFRRELMLALRRREFTEKGTKALWRVVDGWLTGGAAKFGTWDDVVTELFRLGVTRSPIPGAGDPQGPLHLGTRPAGLPAAEGLAGYNAAVAGQHRRHVISSSTLGRAVERSGAGDAPAVVAERVNGWLTRRGLAAVDDGGPELMARTAKRRVWEHVHAHAGNLWNGSPGDNIAIGFMRGPLDRMRKGVLRLDITYDPPIAAAPADVDGDDAMVVQRVAMVEFGEVLALLPEGFYGWGEASVASFGIIGQLQDYLVRLAVQLGDGLSYVSMEEVVENLTAWIRNMDLDTPPLDALGVTPEAAGAYMAALNRVYSMLLAADSEDIFAPGGALDQFLDDTAAIPRPVLPE